MHFQIYTCWYMYIRIYSIVTCYPFESLISRQITSLLIIKLSLQARHLNNNSRDHSFLTLNSIIMYKRNVVKVTLLPNLALIIIIIHRWKLPAKSNINVKNRPATFNIRTSKNLLQPLFEKNGASCASKCTCSWAPKEVAGFRGDKFDRRQTVRD